MIKTEEGSEGTELNTKFSQRRVWLVKLPTFLAESWQQTGNMEVGSVKIKEDKASGKAPEVRRCNFAETRDKIFLYTSATCNRISNTICCY
jgi:hypothetical protein